MTTQSRVLSPRSKARILALLIAAASASAGLVSGSGAAHADAQPGSGYYEIRNVAFGNCVTASLGGTVNQASMTSCTGSLPQEWNEIAYSNGDQLNSYQSLCLQANVADQTVESAPCNGSPFQKWIQSYDKYDSGAIRYYLDPFATNCGYYCFLGTDTSQPSRLRLAVNKTPTSYAPSIDWTRS